MQIKDAITKLYTDKGYVTTGALITPQTVDEKMSALGNLVAGIAHEMNNPLGFISASLKQAKPNIGDIIEHLKLYQKSFPLASEEIINHAE